MEIGQHWWRVGWQAACSVCFVVVFAVCVLWLCFGVKQLFSYRTCKRVEFGPAKMADFSALTTKNASLNAPIVN